MWEENKIYEIQSPGGEISADGVRWVKDFIYGHYGDDAYLLVDEIEPSAWVINKHKYAGTLPKRLWRILNAEIGIKMSPEHMTEIGNRASQYVTRQEVQYWDFTQKFDWNNGQFGDGGSCFWGGRSDARSYILPQLGAWALRLWRKRGEEFAGAGRCWLVPQNENWFVFNYYGPNSCGLFSAARVVAGFLGYNYRKVKVEPFNATRQSYDDTLFINSHYGILIEPGMTQEKNFKISFIDERVRCAYCGSSGIANDFVRVAGTGMYCPNCQRNRNIREINGTYYDQSAYGLIGGTQDAVLHTEMRRNPDYFRSALTNNYWHVADLVMIDGNSVSGYELSTCEDVRNCIIDDSPHFVWNMIRISDGRYVYSNSWHNLRQLAGRATKEETLRARLGDKYDIYIELRRYL